MSRELIRQLYEKKKSIIKAQHDLVIEELTVEEGFTYCPPEKETEFELKLQEIKTKQLAENAKLYRAHFFGSRYTDSFAPSLCVVCFVDHNTDSLMVEVESDRGNDIRQFECVICKHVLRVNPL